MEAALSELIFAYEGCEDGNERAVYRSVSRREYYQGEYQIVPRADANVRIEKGLDADFSILRVSSSSDLKFKRNWRHIQRDRLDMSVLWFVEKGSIVFSHADRVDVVDTGRCAISRSLQPFRMECRADEREGFQVLHVIVPTHLVADFIPDSIRPGASFSSREGDCRLALRTFEILYEEGARVSAKAADGLAREAFGAVGSLVTEEHEIRPHSIVDRRFTQAAEYIRRHAGNPDLSATAVARAVDLSPSYLLQVLKSRGTCFSEVLWNSRMERACDLLLAGNLRAVSVKQISYRSGFKSAAHFSRMFKNATGLTPGEYRNARGAVASRLAG